MRFFCFYEQTLLLLLHSLGTMKLPFDVYCKMSMFKYLCAFIVLCSVASIGSAKNDEYYKTILRILAYSDVDSSAQICVVNNVTVAQNFQSFITRQQSTYSVTAVSPMNFRNTSCQVAYFSNLSDKEENRLIRNYPKQKLLSISDNNPQCELGSGICLSKGVNKPIVIDFNLDSLTRSQVKIQSQVLHIFKK